MEFPIETVRELAGLLEQSGLSEISLETTDEGPSNRLVLKRATGFTLVAGAASLAETASAEMGTEPASAPAAAAHITVPSTAVGMFRLTNPPVRAGDAVRKRQVLGSVEALKIPNDIQAPEDGTILEILASDGQGVEWGQPLFVLEPRRA